jgi:hypothetical protein
MQITFDITNAVATRIQNSICTAQHGYTGFEADGTTVQTKLTFLKSWIIKKIKDEVKQGEVAPLLSSTIANNNSDVENNLVIL